MDAREFPKFIPVSVTMVQPEYSCLFVARLVARQERERRSTVDAERGYINKIKSMI